METWPRLQSLAEPSWPLPWPLVPEPFTRGDGRALGLVTKVSLLEHSASSRDLDSLSSEAALPDSGWQGPR